MTAAAILTPQRQVSRLRQFLWRYPEWWTLILCAIGWRAMLLHFRQHGTHGIHHWMSFSDELQNWMLMVLAMMLPLVRDSFRATAFASLWARRHRSMFGFLIGYSAPWLVIGLAVALLRGQSWTHTYAAPTAAFLLGAIWQFTPMHAFALTECHRTMPLAPLGWQADRDCLHFGWRIGSACALSCWPLMLACAFTGHSLIAMTGGMGLGIAERWSFRPRTGIVITGSLVLAGYYAILMVVPP